MARRIIPRRELKITRYMNYRAEIRKIDKELAQDFPNFPIGRHLALAFDGIDTATLTDKEFYKIFQQYQHDIELGGPISDTFEDDVISDSFNLFKEEEE